MVKNISFRLTVIMLCVILLGIAVTVGVAVAISGSVITRESLAKIQRETRGEERGMDGWLSYQCANITTLADALSQIDDVSEERLAAVIKAVLKENDAYFEVYVGFPNGLATTGSGYEFDYSWWHAPERGWYKLAVSDTSRAHITSPYVDAQTGELCITAVHAVTRGGELLGVAAADIFVTDLQEMTLAATLDSEGYAMLLDSNGDILVHHDKDYAPDADGNYRNLATVMDGIYADLWKQLAGSAEAVQYTDAKGTLNYYTMSTLPSTGWHLVTVLPAKAVTQPITTLILIVIPLTLVMLLLAALLIFLTVRSIIGRPIAALVKAADDLAAGDTGIHIDGRYPGEMGTLAKAFQRITDSVDGQVRSAKAMADGDLTAEVAMESERDVMGNALRNLLSNLRAMVSDISEVAGRVWRGSEQIVSDSQGLARDSMEHVITMAQLSERAEALSADIMRNAERAEKAAGLSGAVKDDAQKGSAQMEQMLSAVKEINDASKSIEKVMKVIEDIARQTNILALNASVEAARAGQYGKGFAVVAGEVRNLAIKSADAAKETGRLITNSIGKAALGASLAEKTSASLRVIVEGISQSTEIVSEIARSSAEQSNSVAKINMGIAQASDVIKQSSLSAEASAAASQDMREQANVLEALVSQFRLGEVTARALPQGRTGITKRTPPPRHY